MGLLLSCCGGGDGGGSSEYTPVNKDVDPDTRRRQMAEAAEARLKQQEGRGLKDPSVLRERQRKAEELERRQEAAGRQGEGALRWQVN